MGCFANSKLASGTSLSTEGSWVDVFWNEVAVTPNSTLYLVFESDNNSMGIAGSVANPYAFGQTYANPGFGPFPNFDYAFRTYASDVSVPEPSSIELLSLGLAGVGLARRRKA